MTIDEREAVLTKVSSVMIRVFHLPAGTRITRATTSNDVPGWDSLSHAMLILDVEEAFGVDLPLDRTYALADVGALADLVCETLESAKT